MRKNNILVRSALIVTFALYLVVSGCIRNYGIPTNMSYTHLKAVSLRELQKKIIQRDIQELPEMKSFYGITRLYGFLWDEEGRDLVLFGEADAEKPSLHFDDFVVSLRNAYCLYCQREGNTMYYSDPSITIDPDPNITQLLDKLT